MISLETCLLKIVSVSVKINLLFFPNRGVESLYTVRKVLVDLAVLD